MKKSTKWVLTLIVLGLMGFMVYSSMARAQTRCEVCVSFNGRRNCARAQGANQQEARRGAQTTACGPLVSGMDETIRCEGIQPTSTQCSNN